MSIRSVDKNCWWVVYDGKGGMNVHNEKGEQIFGQIQITLVDKFDEVPKFIVSAVCNIAGSKEEMMQKINEP